MCIGLFAYIFPKETLNLKCSPLASGRLSVLELKHGYIVNPSLSSCAERNWLRALECPGIHAWMPLVGRKNQEVRLERGNSSPWSSQRGMTSQQSNTISEVILPQRKIKSLPSPRVLGQQGPLSQFPIPETISSVLKWAEMCLGRDEASVMLFLWLRGAHSRWPQNTEDKQYLEARDVSKYGHLGGGQHHRTLDRAQDLLIPWRHDSSLDLNRGIEAHSHTCTQIALLCP